MRTGAIVVDLIPVAGAMIYFSSNEGREREEGASPDEETLTPIMLPNSQVTNIPQANKEPSIAVNPTGPPNIVAASNDYGSPRRDTGKRSFRHMVRHRPVSARRRSR